MYVLDNSLGALGAVQSCGDWPASLPFRESDLHPRFLPVYRRFMQRIKDWDLPFAVRTGARTLDRQCRAICAGGSELSNPADSAHVKLDEQGNHASFAVDLKIIHPRANSTWDVGLDKETHTRLLRPEITGYWLALGNLIATEFPELEWGGNWKKRYKKAARAAGKTEDDIVLGFDPYHVQLKRYRRYAAPMPAVRCEGGRVVYLTPSEQVVETFKQPSTWVWLGLAAGAAWYFSR